MSRSNVRFARRVTKAELETRSIDVVTVHNLPLVLEYWQSVLRQEELLGTRPRARKVQHATELSTQSVASPAGGQDYLKVPLDLASPMLASGRGQLAIPVKGECGAFFETWLVSQYKRSDEGSKQYLAAFPTLLLPRSELAGLLRTAVNVEWRSVDGSVFSVPTAAQRAKKHLPDPPAEMRVSVVAPEGDELPLFVDTRVLRDVLRIDEERVAEFLNEQKAQKPKAGALIEQLCALIQTHVDEEVAVDSKVQMEHALLQRLSRLTALRLLQCRSSAQAFSVALVLDASRNRTTYHVQRDIQAALELHAAGALPSEQPLTMYVGEAVAPQGHRSLLGRFGSRGLTSSQRQAGERCLGTKLCAVQGPPGTGKTHLILSLAAHQLVTNVLPLCEVLQPLSDLLVVTSTNNRAVDNVLTPLSNEMGPNRLSLGLRVGSREVVEKVTAPELMRALRWLERQKEPSTEEWDKARAEVSKLHASIEEALAPDARVRATADSLSKTKLELAAIEAASASKPSPDEHPSGSALPFDVDVAVVKEHSRTIIAHCTALNIRLRALSELAAPTKRTALRALEQHYKLSTQRHIAPLEECLGRELPLGLPPSVTSGLDVSEQRALWEEASETALAVVGHLLALASILEREALGALRKEALLRDVVTLEQRLASEIASSKEVDWSAIEPQLQELFASACVLRECWARKNKTALVATLQRVVATCQNLKSLRSLLANDKGPGVWLKRLYPVWGCTLLSLGNTFEPNLAQVEQVVVDEAGQCHPAYAVSALLRAKRTLLIGDTNQLEPVVDLAPQDEARFVHKREPKEKVRLEPFRVFEGTENSAQSVADRAVGDRPTLQDHFRCQPQIAAICEQLCGYGMIAHTPFASCAHLSSELTAPVLFAPVLGTQTRYAGSWANSTESDEVQAWLLKLLHAGVKPSDIGVITPFRGQLELLWQRLRAARVPLEAATASDDQEQLSLTPEFSRGGVALGTVHRFQGGERRIILFSTTVTETQSLRFLDARVNLINVAASRAREHLVTVGHAATLRAGANTRVLLASAQLAKLHASPS